MTNFQQQPGGLILPTPTAAQQAKRDLIRQHFASATTSHEDPATWPEGLMSRTRTADGTTIECWCKPEHPEVTDLMRDTVTLIRAFYEIPGCIVGGPLHVTIDDDNVDLLVFGWQSLYEEAGLNFQAHWLEGQSPEQTDEMRRTGSAILWAFGYMTEPERLACTRQVYGSEPWANYPPNVLSDGQHSIAEDFERLAYGERDLYPAGAELWDDLREVPEWACDTCRARWEHVVHVD